MNRPNYHKIYEDMIELKYPDKKEAAKKILLKKNLVTKDLDLLNEIIFGFPNRAKQITNSKHRSYTRNEIVDILKFQNESGMNNSQIAKYFKISRNTIIHWRKKII